MTVPTALNRRGFLTRCTPAVAAAACLRETRAAEPISRPGEPRFHLALAAYSFRRYFPSMRGKKQTPPEDGRGIDMKGFIDYCADQGLSGAELTSYFFAPSISDGALRNIKRYAFLRGIAVTGTAIGNDFTKSNPEEHQEQLQHTKMWIDRSQALGAPHIRVFAGPAKKMPKADAKKQCIEALEECCHYAGERGVILGLENHGGIVAEADDLLEIVKAVDSPWIGINLDSGNFKTRDPYGDLARCAPYAVNVQVKVEMHPQGAKSPQPTDYGRISEILREANYQGFVTLEYESKESPFEAIPQHLASLRSALTSSS